MHFFSKITSAYLHGIGFLLLTFLWMGCRENEIINNPAKPQNLIRYEKLMEIEKNQLTALLQISGYALDTSLIRYDIEVYRIFYTTSLKGEETEASGLLALPEQAPADIPILMGFSPSLSSPPDSVDLDDFGLSKRTELLSTLGFISLIPDYVGWGRAGVEIHPYLIKEANVQNSLDILNAAAEMLKEMKQSYDPSLLLIGYSQGAYQAMVTLEAVEKSSQKAWKPQLVVAGASPFDLQALGRTIASHNTYASPELLAYLVSAYHMYYEWPGSLEQYFQQPYADLIYKGYNGELELEYIKSQLTTDLSQLLQPEFFEALRIGSNTLLEEALDKNSIEAWPTEAYVRGYHVPVDRVIPVSNSRSFYADMEKLQPDKVEYIEMEEATSHVNGGLTMLQDVLPFLVSQYAVEE